MKYFLSFILVLCMAYSVSSMVALAGILPTSRGGTGANITPSNGAIITSNASTFQASTSLLMPSGGTVVLASGATTASGAGLYIPAGSSLTTPEKGAIESNGTHLYWTDSTGTRQLIK